MEDNTRSEDVLGEKWDRCLGDTLIKTFTGLGAGSALSLALYKRITWPAVLGVGIGLGMGIANTQHEFRHTDIYRKVQRVQGGSPVVVNSEGS